MQTQKMVQVAVAEGHTVWGSGQVTQATPTGGVTESIQKPYKPGETLEVTEGDAQYLIDAGFCVRPNAPPSATYWFIGT